METLLFIPLALLRLHLYSPISARLKTWGERDCGELDLDRNSGWIGSRGVNIEKIEKVAELGRNLFSVIVLARFVRGKKCIIGARSEE